MRKAHRAPLFQPQYVFAFEANSPYCSSLTASWIYALHLRNGDFSAERCIVAERQRFQKSAQHPSWQTPAPRPFASQEKAPANESRSCGPARAIARAPMRHHPRT